MISSQMNLTDKLHYLKSILMSETGEQNKNLCDRRDKIYESLGIVGTFISEVNTDQVITPLGCYKLTYVRQREQMI